MRTFDINAVRDDIAKLGLSIISIGKFDLIYRKKEVRFLSHQSFVNPFLKNDSVLELAINNDLIRIKNGIAGGAIEDGLAANKLASCFFIIEFPNVPTVFDTQDASIQHLLARIKSDLEFLIDYRYNLANDSEQELKNDSGVLADFDVIDQKLNALNYAGLLNTELVEVNVSHITESAPSPKIRFLISFIPKIGFGQEHSNQFTSLPSKAITSMLNCDYTSMSVLPTLLLPKYQSKVLNNEVDKSSHYSRSLNYLVSGIDDDNDLNSLESSAHFKNLFDFFCENAVTCNLKRPPNESHKSLIVMDSFDTMHTVCIAGSELRILSLQSINNSYGVILTRIAFETQVINGDYKDVFAKVTLSRKQDALKCDRGSRDDFIEIFNGIRYVSFEEWNA